MGSQHTTARLDLAILGSGDGCSGRGSSTGRSRREWQHTHQHAGLPLYPADLCLHTLPENQQLSSPRIYGGDKACHDILQSNGYRAPDIMFDSLNILAFSPEVLSIPGSISLGVPEQ
ncbi:hypothetical protein OROHE_019823 [Orobanche hederae]